MDIYKLDNIDKFNNDIIIAVRYTSLLSMYAHLNLIKFKNIAVTTNLKNIFIRKSR